MKFPSYPSTLYEQPPTPVVQGYVQFFGSFERDNRAAIERLARNNAQQVAMRIGRGCLIAADGNAPAADRVFRRAQRDLQPFLEPPIRRTPIGRSAIELQAIAHLLEAREDQERVDDDRRAAHERTVRDIKRMRDQLTRTGDKGLSGGAATHVIGKLAERTALATVTRLGAHPWTLAMPALTHHDMGDKRCSNFDMLLVEASPSQPLTIAHKVQVKAACLGVCGDPQPEHTQVQRMQYAPDIRFLSGCCDLDIKGPRDDPDRFALPDLLIKEAENKATSYEVGKLDAITGSLLLSLTMDSENRMGTLGYALAG